MSAPIVRFRPLLVSGMLAKDADGNTYILVDSEQSEAEQTVALWHEILHLAGFTDEGQVEAMAKRLAEVSPEILPAMKAVA